MHLISTALLLWLLTNAAIFIILCIRLAYLSWRERQ